MNPYQQYKETQVQTASPEALVVLLYDGAIRFLEQARKQIQGGGDPGAALLRAQDIITELMGSLNPDAGTIAGSLYQLYDYYLFRLVQAYGTHKEEPVGEVIAHMRDLRGAWAQAAQQSRAAQAPAAVRPAAGDGAPAEAR